MMNTKKLFWYPTDVVMNAGRIVRWGVAVLAIWFVLPPCHGQGTFQWTATFDGPPVIPPGDNIGVTSYYEGGVEFSPIGPYGQFTRAGGGVSVYPENGTAYIFNGFGDSLAGTMAAQRFGLYSVDLSEFSTLYNFPRTVQFIGYHPGGSTVTTEFTTDGIIDGTGPLADFQTFFFDNQFVDLIRFEIPGYGYALDNMVFTTVVPEPGTNALLLLGAALFGIRLFKKASVKAMSY